MNLKDNVKFRVAVVAWAGLLTTAQCLDTVKDVKTYTEMKEKQDKTNDQVKSLKKEITKTNKEKDEKIKALEKKIDEQGKKLLEIEKAKADARKESPTNGEPITLRLSYYGEGAEENGGYAGITCTGAKLVDGMVASNVYDIGTKFMWDGKVYTVSDTGGDHFDSYDRLDVFVPRYPGESKDSYDRRISDEGRKVVQAVKLN